MIPIILKSEINRYDLPPSTQAHTLYMMYFILLMIRFSIFLITANEIWF